MKSCDHTAGRSFEAQAERLKECGYAISILHEVVETLMTTNGRLERKVDKNRRPDVIPYIDKISHNLKRVANRLDIQVMRQASLERLCPKINSQKESTDQSTVQHANKYVDCSVGVTYEIQFTRGRVYVGQTGTRVNIRLRERAL